MYAHEARNVSEYNESISDAFGMLARHPNPTKDECIMFASELLASSARLVKFIIEAKETPADTNICVETAKAYIELAKLKN